MGETSLWSLPKPWKEPGPQCLTTDHLSLTHLLARSPLPTPGLSPYSVSPRRTDVRML